MEIAERLLDLLQPFQPLLPIVVQDLKFVCELVLARRKIVAQPGEALRNILSFVEEIDQQQWGRDGCLTFEELIGAPGCLANFEEQFNQFCRDLLDRRRFAANLEFQQMPQALFRFAQATVRGIQLRAVIVRCFSFRLGKSVDTVRVHGSRECEEFCFQRFLIKPGLARLIEKREVIGHGAQALKLSPQEQLVAAFGFFTLNPPSCSAST